MRKSTSEHTIQSESELQNIASDLLESNHAKLFCLRGNLGAGKTALVKAICDRLNCVDQPSSPTFSLINEYHCPNGKVFHIDLYRLGTINEAFEIGIEEYLNSSSYCFIEWPELIESIIYENYIDVNIESTGVNTRKLLISYK